MREFVPASHARLTTPGVLSWGVDAAAAVAVVAVFWLPAWARGLAGGQVWAGVMLAVVVGVAMIMRWRISGIAAAAAAIATITGVLLGVSNDPMLAVAWCLYPLAVARASSTRAFVLVIVSVVTALAAVTGVPEQSEDGQWVVIAVAALGFSWLVGLTEGRRIQSVREAERARTAERATRVQLGVARDVHDVVGHALGVISAEAGVTRTLSDASEQELHQSLADIEGHARSALGEVQALVRSLRATGSDDPDATGPGLTAPGLSRLPELIAATRAAGVGVELSVEVDEAVGQRVGTVAFRIAQESLSNVVRHAPGASCTVEVRRDGKGLLMRVRDDGPGLGRDVMPGCGLRGMKERAESVGGSVTWQNLADSGLEVEGRLPLGLPQ